MKKIIFLALSISLFQHSCKTEEANYEKKYNTWVLLNYLVLSSPDPQGACVTSYTTAETCLKKSSDFPLSPYPVNETTIMTIISGSSVNATYSSYCSNLLSSSTFKNYTERAKECAMKCNNTYWQNRIDQSSCTGKFTTILTESATGSISCIAECFKTANNNY